MATPQMLRKQINDACDDTLDTYKLDAKNEDHCYEIQEKVSSRYLFALCHVSLVP